MFNKIAGIESAVQLDQEKHDNSRRHDGHELSLAIVRFLVRMLVFLWDVLPGIDSTKRYDRLKLSDRHVLGLNKGLFLHIFPVIDSARRHDRLDLVDRQVLGLVEDIALLGHLTYDRQSQVA